MTPNVDVSIPWPSPAASVWPSVIPIAALVAADIYLRLGGKLNVDGSSGILLLVAAGWGGAALLWGAVALSLCLFRLARAPALQSPGNLRAAGAAVLYHLVVLGFVLYAVFQATGSA